MPNKQNILISAGGTATSWHLAKIIKANFQKYFNVYICDCNPAHLIAASRLADTYIQVPLITDPDYREIMLDNFRQHHIDIFVPLIDFDVYEFVSDSKDMRNLNVTSTGVSKWAASILQDKETWSNYLQEKGILVPMVYDSATLTSLNDDDKVFIKPQRGFGSKGARVVIKRELDWVCRDDDYIVQEICASPEITVEVFNFNGLIKSICRERLETKAGVCTKAKIWFDAELQLLTEQLCEILPLPTAFCYQVMKNSVGEWVVIDLNPRLGAGTALSSTCGWSLVSAALCSWAGLSLSPSSFLNVPVEPKYVVRVYEEFLMN